MAQITGCSLMDLASRNQESICQIKRSQVEDDNNNIERCFLDGNVFPLEELKKQLASDNKYLDQSGIELFNALAPENLNKLGIKSSLQKHQGNLDPQPKQKTELILNSPLVKDVTVPQQTSQIIPELTPINYSVALNNLLSKPRGATATYTTPLGKGCLIIRLWMNHLF